MDDLFPVYFGLLHLLLNLRAIAEAEHQPAVGVDRDVVHRGGPEGRVESQRESVQRVDGKEKAAELVRLNLPPLPLLPQPIVAGLQLLLMNKPRSDIIL